MRSLGVLGIFLTIFFVTAVFVAKVHAQTSCMGYGSDSVPPSGFGASWDVFDSAKALLVKSDCPPTGTVLNVTVGKGDTSQYVYSGGYVYTAKSLGVYDWVAFSLTGTATATSWLVGSGSASLTISSAISSTSPLYYVGFVCSNRAEGWRCGCQDFACATPRWQIQSYKGLSS